MRFSIKSSDEITLRIVAGLGILALIIIVIWASWPARPADDSKVITEVSVAVAKVRRLDIHTYVYGYGVVETALAEGGHAGGGAKLAAPIAGIVLAIPVTEGQYVKAGTVIVRLDDRMTASAVSKASESLNFAERQFERQKQLLMIGGTSQKAYQSAQQQLVAARADLAAAHGGLAQTQLTSPLDGQVARLNVSPGQTVDPNTIVAEIVDMNRLIVTVDVPASEAEFLVAGQPAEIARNDASGTVARGKVSFVSPSVDTRTDTALVRVALSPGASLRPGELVGARIVSATHVGVLAVPVESVVKTGDKTVIHIVRGNLAYQVPVNVGPRDGAVMEIDTSAVHAGDIVVTSGAYGLPERTKIDIKASH